MGTALAAPAIVMSDPILLVVAAIMLLATASRWFGPHSTNVPRADDGGA